MKLPALLTMQAMKLPAPATTPPQDQMILAVLAVGACVFFTYHVKNKKQDNDRPTAQHEQKQPPKRRHMP